MYSKNKRKEEWNEARGKRGSRKVRRKKSGRNARRRGRAGVKEAGRWKLEVS